MASMEMREHDLNRSTLEIMQFADCNSMPASLQPDNNAISLRGVYKRYGNHIVLKDFHMVVPEGCIFGLLGSSGCGKTTLLNCIMGICCIDIGEIDVKYKDLSDFGLMPQELALIPQLNAKETFNYFGKLFGLSDKYVNDRIQELSKLLELPNIELQTSKLSGGEQRRVSLACALLHDPKLLLLDEPTVGLDPILSQSIWDYLKMITNEQQKTVIITTHYIEEARQAHNVGLMRQGKLVECGPPMEIMSKSNCSTLEEAFLKLSVDSNKVDKEFNWPNKSNVPSIQTQFNKNDYFSLNRFQAQFYKNTLFIVREALFVALLFVLPTMNVNIVHWALGRDPNDISIAVFNEDSFNCSFYDCYNSCLQDGISCCYLEHLQKTVPNFDLIAKDNLEEGKQMIVKNKAWGLLHFSKNFSSILTSRSEDYFQISNVSNETIDAGQIKVYSDSSDKIIEIFLKRKLISGLFDYLKILYRNCGWQERAAVLPILIEKPIYGSLNSFFTHFQSPAMIIFACFYFPMMMTPIFLLDEKFSGFLPRSIASGVTIIELLVALIAIEMVVVVIQTIIYFIVFYGIYHHPFVIDNIWLPFSLCLYSGISGIFLGIFLSLAANSYFMALLGGNGVFIVMLLTSGFIWPVEGVNPYLVNFFRLAPLTLTIDSFRGMTARGWTFLHAKVLSGYVSITLWTLFYILLTWLVVHKKGIIDRK